jgi:hypothetical protein
LVKKVLFFCEIGILSEKQFQIGKKRLVILAKQCQKEKSKLVISMASLLVSFGG